MNENGDRTEQPIINVEKASELRLQSMTERYPVVVSALLSAFPNRDALRAYVLEMASIVPVTVDSDHADELARALNEGYEGEWQYDDQTFALSDDDADVWGRIFQ